MSMSAVKNLASGVIFVFVKVHEDKKLTVLNPEGKLLTVPPGLFDVPFPVRDTDLHIFSSAQREHWEKLTKPTIKKTSQRSVAKKIESKPQRTFLDKEWQCQKLTFYKHNIEPLNSKEHFRILVDHVGLFDFTKEAFEKYFNDVIIAKTYWQEGYFSYEKIPEKAWKFLISSQKESRHD